MNLDNFLTELRQSGYEPIHHLRVSGEKWERLKYNGETVAKSSGAYKLIQNQDGSYFASYGSQKDPQGFRSWRSGVAQEKTWEEMTAEKSARESHRRFMEKVAQERHEKIGRWIAKAIEWMPAASEHPYLTAKGVGAHGIKIRVKTGELLIPRYGFDGQIYSLQRIKKWRQGFWKGYFKGALGKDLYYPIWSETDDFSVIAIAEGFATGASVREATGYPVAVCFDSGGIMGVARGLKKRFPNARLVIAADNDQWVLQAVHKTKEIDTGAMAGDDPRWSEWRETGKLFNPGIDKARAAAASVGGAFVIAPDFEATHTKKYTDFNDLAQEKGPEYVKALFLKALEIPTVKAAEEASGGGFDNVIDPSESRPSVDVQPPPHGDSDTNVVSKKPKGKGDMAMNFRVLGYNNGQYFYYPFALRQIVSLTASGHSMQNLMQLDHLENWEAKWRDEDGKMLAKHQTIAIYAADAMMKIAKQRGVFMEESAVRGAGAWLDDGRIILHCGDTLFVDGNYVKFEDIISEYTYVAAKKLMRPARDHALTNTEARRLRTICESITWENQLSGTLLAGWLVIAPICAALKYRPHIYLTGEAESGKSTVMDMIIKPVLGKLALCMDGGTTEPRIREVMGYDGRPLVYDEAEPSPAMTEVIGLARKASTGAVVGKFGQRAFKARFCACFSAINPPVNKTADESRISFMHLKKNRRSTAMKDYDELLSLIESTITEDFSQRMIARTLTNMNTLITNIRVFQRAVRKSIGGARASQQIGTMLAGVYLLGSTSVATDEQALEIVNKFSWTDHTIIDQAGDPIRLQQWIATSLVRTRTGLESSVGDLIASLKNDPTYDVTIDRVLRNHGIAVRLDDGRVDIASQSQNLAKLLRGTEWEEKWSRTLSDIAGAEKLKSVYFSPGLKTSGISLPIELFIGNDLNETPAMPDDDWWPQGRE